MVSWRRRCWLIAAASLSYFVAADWAAPPARAHAIESTLERVAGLNRTLALQSSFSNGEPAAGAVVSLVAPGSQPIALGQTDAEGQLHFRLPEQADAAWEVRVDQGPGHRDYLELPPGSLQAGVGAVKPPTRLSASVGLSLLRQISVSLTMGAIGGGVGAVLLGLLLPWPPRHRS